MGEIKLKEWALKLLILGDMAVGKTSLVTQYTEHSFEQDYHPTLGVNIISKDIEIDQIKALIRLIFWDIAGQDKYEKARSAYYDGCSGALLVYDLTRYDTFLNIESKWLKDLQKHVKKKCDYILIGNKMDLKEDRNVNTEDGKALAKKIKAIDFLETSALNGENVEKSFLRLVYRILNNYGIKFNII